MADFDFPQTSRQRGDSKAAFASAAQGLDGLHFHVSGGEVTVSGRASTLDVKTRLLHDCTSLFNGQRVIDAIVVKYDG